MSGKYYYNGHEVTLLYEKRVGVAFKWEIDINGDVALADARDITYIGPCVKCGQAIKTKVDLPKHNLCMDCLAAFAEAAASTTPLVVGTWQGSFPKSWSSPQQRGAMTRRFNRARWG